MRPMRKREYQWQLPVVYHEGTRAYSGTFYSGITQSYSYLRSLHPASGIPSAIPCLGSGDSFLSIWTVVGTSSILEHPKATCSGRTSRFFSSVASLTGLVVSLRRVATITVRTFPGSVGTGNTLTFAGDVGSSALYLPSGKSRSFDVEEVESFAEVATSAE